MNIPLFSGGFYVCFTDSSLMITVCIEILKTLKFLWIYGMPFIQKINA